jgi:hypothetical protein
MTKMRKYTFIDPSLPEGEDTKVIESLGYKKAVKSYQVSSKAPEVNVYWTSKKGTESSTTQVLPLGRGKKIGK